LADEAPMAKARERRAAEARTAWLALHAADLFCETCGRETPHRVLRVDERRISGREHYISGVARCRDCQVTHPFQAEASGNVDVAVIVSDGPVSIYGSRSLPARRRLQVGSRIPSSDPPLRIHRIDRKDGSRVPEAPSDEIATLWASPDRGHIVPVSVQEGRATTSLRLALAPGSLVTVDEELVTDGGRLTVVALRARGRTWRRPRDGFPAGEIQRVYARRKERPPAGNSGWRRPRETSSARASSVSRAARSRSSPGVTRNRSSPRARRAAGGATE
jgi:uncharacterized Zn finger protein